MELLVVLAIITILVAILAPTLWFARNKAHSTVCLSNLHQLGISVRSYADDWDDTYPNAPGTAFSGSLSASDIPNVGILPPQTGLNLYPSQGAYIWGVLTLTNKSLNNSTFVCPNDKGAPNYNYPEDEPVWERNVSSYMWDPDATPDVSNSTANAPSVNGASMADIADSSKARLLQDYGAVWHTVLKTSVTNGVRVQQGSVNVAFADGHAGTVRSSQVLTQAGSGAGSLVPALSSVSAASSSQSSSPQATSTATRP